MTFDTSLCFKAIFLLVTIVGYKKQIPTINAVFAINSFPEIKLKAIAQLYQILKLHKMHLLRKYAFLQPYLDGTTYFYHNSSLEKQ